MKKVVIVLLFLMLMLPTISNAQGCSLCTKTAAGLDSKSAKGLNMGILYLAFFPLTIMGTIGFLWWKNNKSEPE